MRILIGVDGSALGLNGARLVATLPLSPSDEVIVASAVERPALLGAWGHVSTDLTGRLYDEARLAASRAVSQAAPCSTLVAAHRAGPGRQT